MRIQSLRAKNFRSFIDTDHISLKKINLLVGKNSIGKSSFARIWPLFSQARYATKKSPVLWNGNLVDFGGFEDVISRYATSQEIEFEFTLINNNDISPLKSKFLSGNYINNLNNTINISISMRADKGRTVCNNLRLQFSDYEIIYKYDKNGNFEDVDFKTIGENFKQLKTSYSLYKVSTPPSFFAPIPSFYIKEGGASAWSPMHMRLYSFLRSNLHQRISKEKIHEICSRLNIIGSKSEILEVAKKFSFDYISWKQFITELEQNDRTLTRFAELVNLASSELLLRDIDRDIKNYFTNVSYILPLRATAQRYYRRQELAVENIDPTGSNLAFFLSSLSETEEQNLNNWLKDSLEISISTDDSAGHVSVKITDITTGRRDNMADMGFGFSQVLPLAIQAWIAIRDSESPHERILVWEQPELHLHPAMQRKLARLIANLMQSAKNNNLYLIAETHSQSMINEFGDLVESNDLSCDDIQILLFEQNSNNETKITSTEFDGDGQLKHWPYGFLAV